MTTESQKRQRSRPTPHPAHPATGAGRSRLVIGAAVAVVVVALVIAVVAGSGGGGGGDAATAPAPTADNPDGDAAAAPDDAVSIAGSALPDLPDAGPDPAVGQPMPMQSGTGLDGAPVSLPAPGRPTLVMYVAHWCPHCQAEVPVVQDWVDDGGLPAGVDLVTVSTAADDRRPNYPPADWLAGEGWTAPVLADDAAGSAARAAGLTAFPFFVAVDADGTVVTRVSGELTADQLDAVVAEVSRGAA